MSERTPGPWKAIVRSVGQCGYSFGWGEDCCGGHPVYSEFIQPLGIQMHGRDFDQSHARAKKKPPVPSADARLIAAAPDMLDLLVRVSEYLDDRADTVDGEDGPLPNAAMSLGQEVDALLAKLKEGK